MAGAKDTVKAAVRRVANALGYDIVAFDSGSSRWRLMQLLERHGVTIVFDVGANAGQFGWDMRELGYRGRIVSFEPLKSAFAQLDKAARTDTAWQAVNIGLGAIDEERVIHVAANSQSSSFLPMLEAHEQAAPESRYQSEQSAAIRRLEGIWGKYCDADDKVFLKIDTQGFEKHVLEGARASLGAIPVIQLECSLVPLYGDADLIEGAISHMRALGYDPVDVLPTFHHSGSNNLMQADIVFVRQGA